MRAALRPYKSADAFVEIPRGEARTVSRGQPLEHAKVGLIDLDRTPGEEPTWASFRTAYPEQPGGSFLFRNVPLGRYLLVFNPDGPQAGGFQPFPLESTYYPNGAGRAQAQTIEINRAGMRLVGKDVIAGPPVSFRAVTVKVRFPDGSPMTTATVEVIGEPLEPSGISWRDRGYISKEHTETRFQVPANRKVRISVRDWYRRDLKKTYQSTHLPGLTPVTQEFVVAVP